MKSKKALKNVISILEDALESIHSTLEKEQPKWYERKPFKKTLCWVSDVDKKVTDERIMRVIAGYHKGYKYPFCFTDGIIYMSGYKYAVPLTKEEVLKFIVEEQENE